LGCTCATWLRSRLPVPRCEGADWSGQGSGRAPDAEPTVDYPDFAGGLSPDEPWTTTAELGADWARSYATFVTRSHRQSPEAVIVIGWPDLRQQTNADFIALAAAASHGVEAATDRGGFRIAFMEMPSGQG